MAEQKSAKPDKVEVRYLESSFGRKRGQVVKVDEKVAR